MSFAQAYARIVGATFVAAAILGGAGWMITRASHTPSVRSVIAGCAVSWFTACIGAVPIAQAVALRKSNQAEAVLLSTGIRFLGVLMLVVPITLSGWVDRVVFVSCVAASYLVLLALDTVIAVPMIRRASEGVK